MVARGGRLALVGGSAEARKLAAGAPNARVVDARGGTVVPGAAWRAGALAAAPGAALEAGGAADFVLLAGDVARPGAAPLGQARVLLTVVGGQVVHDDAGGAL